MEKTTALVPNAQNAVAESIRKGTRCRLCEERIEDGQEIYDLGDETKWDCVHVVCHDGKTS